VITCYHKETIQGIYYVVVWYGNAVVLNNQTPDGLTEII